MVRKRYLEQLHHRHGGQLAQHNHINEREQGVGAFRGRVVIPPSGTFGHPLSSSSPRMSEGFGALRLPDTLHPLRQEDSRRLHRVSPQNHKEHAHG